MDEAEKEEIRLLAELTELRVAALDFIGGVSRAMLVHDKILVDFPLQNMERLLGLLDPKRPGFKLLMGCDISPPAPNGPEKPSGP